MPEEGSPGSPPSDSGFPRDCGAPETAKSPRKTRRARAEVTVHLRDAAWARTAPAIERVVRRALDTVLTEEPRAVAVVLADDAFVHGLNARFRGQDKPTNVLSFPAAAAAELGDIVLAFETVAREARSEDKTFTQHASHLVVHGALHLLGHDHQSEVDAARMRAAEVAALAGLGLPDPYLIDIQEEAP